jgi:hypothetical protein
MGEAVALYQQATACFGALGAQQGGRLVLSLFFKAVLGVQRMFHFDTLHDVGFAWLTGGRRILGRTTLGGLVRAVSTRAVGKFLDLTRPVVTSDSCLAISLDEHVVARFTRKFRIRKGFHTIRNKHMRAEKLFFSFATGARTLLDLIVTPGNGKLARVSSKMLRALRARSGGPQLRVVLDAGAAQSHRELLALADENHNQVLLVRAPRRVTYMNAWKKLPAASFTAYDEPGRYKGAPPKRIHVTETTTSIRADKRSPPRAVRTIVVREEKRRGKDRWHALFIFRDNATSAVDLIAEFRARQHHEQTYRILLHDAFVDTVPSGYNKKSPNPDRPGFRKNAITLYAWLSGLAVNKLIALTAEFPARFKLAHPRTLRRWWLNFPADLYTSESHLFVVLQPRWFRTWWEKKIPQLNNRRTRVPWMGNRLVLYSLDRLPPSRAEPSGDPEASTPGVRC